MYPTTKQFWQTVGVPIYWGIGLFFVTLSCTAWAESGTRPQVVQPKSVAGASPRVFAEPTFSDSNPYQPGLHAHVKLLVAANGYSVVALRDRQKWVEGDEAYQTIFDGQLYWFSDGREKAIFEAAPEKYAPVLGGDCLVTFSETGEQVPGDPRYGVVYRGRVYFFAGEQRRERFQNHTERYLRADVAHDGNCVVCQIDLQKKIQGLPATVATVGGLRYYFADAHQRATFGANLSRYGAHYQVHAQQTPSPPPSHGIPPQLLTPDSPAVSQQALADAQPLTDASRDESPDGSAKEVKAVPADKLAMEGYCPVSIRERGIWIRGNKRYQVEHHDKVYLLASEARKKLFQANPQFYLPALLGNCVVTLKEKNQHTAGSVFHSLLDNEQLYLFASAEEKRAFKADPFRYSEVADAEAISEETPAAQ